MSGGAVPGVLVLIEAGWAGVLACLACLNLAWFVRDRDRLLLWAGVTSGSAVVSVSVSLAGLVLGAEAPWMLLVPLRSLAVGLMVSAFILALNTLTPLPYVRLAIVVVALLRVPFLVSAIWPEIAWQLPPGSASPVYQPLVRGCLAATLVVVVVFVVRAVSRLWRRAQIELAVTAVCAVLPMMVAMGLLVGWKLEVASAFWMMPLAVLVGIWSGRHVGHLRGSLSTAIEERQAAERRAHQEARTDTLTGLPNQRGLSERLQPRLENVDEGSDLVMMVALVDLDRVRTQEGELIAEALAVQAARALQRYAPHGEVARLGESAYAVAVPWSRAHPVSRLASLCEGRCAPFRRQVGLPSTIPIHIGIALATPQLDADELVRWAHSAATEAQEQGRAVEVFAPDLHALQNRRARLGRLLSGAVASGEIEVHYQPVVDTVTGRRVSVEALARWRHHGRLHSPDEWIPLAERRGLMPQIGQEVLRIAARDQPALGCTVAVNVSPGQLAAPAFVRSVLRTVGDLCPRDRIVLEITEDAIMADFSHAMAVLQRLREAGVRIALDDFGTKYSSLSRVAQLPFDVLKIDRSFVQRLDTAEGRAMVTAIEALTRALGKASVAEGVETAEQLAVLREIGCHLVQGFLTGRPARLSTLLAMDAEESARSLTSGGYGVSTPPGPSVRS